MMLRGVPTLGDLPGFLTEKGAESEEKTVILRMRKVRNGEKQA